MTTVKNSDMQNIYLYLQQSGIGAIASSSDNNFMNTIWSSVGDIENIAEGNDQQKANGIQNLLTKVLGLIDNLCGTNNETTRANKEVQGNGKVAQQTDIDIEKTQQELQSEIDQITAELDGHIAVIEAAQANITDSTKNLQEQLNALKKIQEEIQKRQEALKSTDDPAEQQKLLGEIKTFASLIPAITSTLSGMQESLTKESQNVSNAYSAVELLKGNAVDVTTNAEEKIISLAATSTENVQNNVASATTGTVENIPTGTTANAAAAAASSNMFTASEAPKLYRVGSDQTGAGTTRLSGVATNLQTIQQGLGRLGETNEILSQFENAIGNSLENFDTLIGAWNQSIEPMITSIGSVDYKEVEKASEELVQAADADISTLTTNNNGETGNNTVNSADLQTVKFDLSKLGMVKLEEEEN